MERQEKILAVDDNQMNLAIFEELLEDEGYNLEVATTGSEALETAVAFQPDLVLLDIMMPGMDGYEVCRKIRANPLLKYIKIIMVSAKAMTSERLEGYEAGADDYITKPFEGDELLAKVRVYLRLKCIEEMEKMRQNFTLTVTHEMRTPVTVAKNILSNAADNRYGEISSELRQQLETAGRNMDHLKRIICSFFEISRIDAGKMDLQRTQFYVHDVVSDVVDRLKPKAASRQIALDAVASTDKFLIDADLEMFVRILEHLLENAIKFIHEGGSISVRVKSRNGKITVDVEDDGPGIPPNDLDSIFDRYVQVRRNTGPDEHGPGLGLAVAKGLVELHGGCIWARNRPKCGAVFSFQLPISVETESAAEPILSGAGSDPEIPE